jgi:hypothetical protein
VDDVEIGVAAKCLAHLPGFIELPIPFGRVIDVAPGDRAAERCRCLGIRRGKQGDFMTAGDKPLGDGGHKTLHGTLPHWRNGARQGGNFRNAQSHSDRRLLIARDLCGPKAMVGTAPLQQVLVSPCLQDPPITHDNDPVSKANGRKPVRDNDDRLVAHV